MNELSILRSIRMLPSPSPSRLSRHAPHAALQPVCAPPDASLCATVRRAAATSVVSALEVG